MFQKKNLKNQNLLTQRESFFKKGVVMAMKFLCMFIFMSSCSEFEPYEREEIVFPDKELQEIIFVGDYYPETKDSKERYNYTGKKYCYNKTEEDKKFKGFEEISKGKFKAQLYNKEGDLLTETFFIVKKVDTDIMEIYELRAYLPFQEGAYETRIVRIDKNKEIILDTTILIPLEELAHNTFPLTQPGPFWHYDPKIECHIAPGPR